MDEWRASLLDGLEFPAEARDDLARMLAAEGMPVRAIAEALGTSKSAAGRAVAAIPQSPDSDGDEVAGEGEVTEADGVPERDTTAGDEATSEIATTGASGSADQTSSGSPHRQPPVGNPRQQAARQRERRRAARQEAVDAEREQQEQQQEPAPGPAESGGQRHLREAAEDWHRTCETVIRELDRMSRALKDGSVPVTPDVETALAKVGGAYTALQAAVTASRAENNGGPCRPPGPAARMHRVRSRPPKRFRHKG